MLPALALALTVATVDPPPGFVSFCLRHADQCAADAPGPSVVSMTAALMALLDKVNRSVNYDIVPASDEVQYDRGEYWEIVTHGYGSCHDYMVTKRAALIAAGLPMRALRMAVVLTPRGERHAVLVVATDKGDYVLDNLTTEIKPLADTGYRMVEIEGANNPWKWEASR